MKNYPLYISEIDDDVAKMLTRKTLMFKGMEIGLFIVSKSGEDVGRCAAIIKKSFRLKSNGMQTMTQQLSGLFQRKTGTRT